MASHGYLIYLIRAGVPNRTRTLNQLSRSGSPTPTDLLDELEAQFSVFGDTYQSDKKNAEGFRVREADRVGRSLRLRIHKGPEGNPGETYNIETDESEDTGDTTALLSALRATVYIPEKSYFGLLFVERTGGRHLKELLARIVFKPVALKRDLAIRLESFAEVDDWRSELGDQGVLRISESLVASQGGDASTPDDTVVRVVAEGTKVRQVSDDIKEQLFTRLERIFRTIRVRANLAPLEDRRYVYVEKEDSSSQTIEVRRKAPKSVFTVQDENEYQALVEELAKLNEADENPALRSTLQELVPIERDGLKSQRWEVALGEEKPERSFVVEGNSVPQFVYLTQGRLLDNLLRQTWEAHATRIFGVLGVSLADDWLLAQATNE
jgi:hypothetical protein